MQLSTSWALCVSGLGHANQDFDAARVGSCGQPGIYGVCKRKNLWLSSVAGRVT